MRQDETAPATRAEAASYHAAAGNALRQQGRLAEAVSSYRRAIAFCPDYPEALNNLGVTLLDQGRVDDADACYRQTIARNPDYTEAHVNLGIALHRQDQLDEAVACYRRALDLRPDLPEIHNILGVVLRQWGQIDEAEACFRRAIALRSDHAEAHANLALLLLSRGDMAAGWKEFEWRWQTQGMRADRRTFAQPQWRGEAASGRTLLIHPEMGFGDTLQFCRYAALAAARGLRVVMEVQAQLVRLLRSLAGVDAVVAYGTALPPFDLHCPMMSMPLALGTTVDTIPGAASYLQADAAQAAAWHARLAAMGSQAPRIGLVWAGNPRPHSPADAAGDRRRSIAPERLAPLFDLPGLQFFSLQKVGPAAPAHFPLIDFMAEMADFADTAALIANLDLVISVDTAVAHLAAALGKPVWLLNRFDVCWRWMQGRRETPWYPTLRLYRQPAPGDWGSVIAEVVNDLGSIR